MKQEFVTLPRAVVEQAIAALTDLAGWRAAPLCDLLHAALEQPQVEQERCHLCDSTGDIHGLDGEWRGECPYCRPQPPVVEECLTDELKPRFSAHDDAERLKSVARGMSYNDHGEAVWKHTLMEIAVRLESGGYAAPQPPALEQQVEQESTCKESLQVEQEPVAWLHQCNKRPDLIEMSFSKREPTLASKGYKARPLIFGDIAHQQPKREPLTVEQIAAATGAKPGTPTWPLAVAFTRAIEAAHNIK